MDLIGQGLELREAAEQMRIRYRTAVQYRADIMRRVGLTGYVGFAQWAHTIVERMKLWFASGEGVVDLDDDF